MKTLTYSLQDRTVSNTKDLGPASTNVFFILSGSLVQSEITDVYLYGNINVSMKTLKEEAVEEAKCHIFKNIQKRCSGKTF